MAVAAGSPQPRPSQCETCRQSEGCPLADLRWLDSRRTCPMSGSCHYEADGHTIRWSAPRSGHPATVVQPAAQPAHTHAGSLLRSYGARAKIATRFHARPSRPAAGVIAPSASACRLKCRLSGSTARQPHGKHRTLARLARHRHIAPHHARKLASDCKAEARAAEVLSSRGIGLAEFLEQLGLAEACATEILRGRGIGLAELLEQLGLLLRRHADAGVGDGELDKATAIAHLACRKLDLARFGELARIAQEIEQIKTCPTYSSFPPSPTSRDRSEKMRQLAMHQ